MYINSLIFPFYLQMISSKPKRTIRSSSHQVFIASSLRIMHLPFFPQSSLEVDDTVSQQLDDTAQTLAVECEQEISQQLGLEFIPAMNEFPRQTFQRIQNHFWSNSVAVPLDPVPLDPDLHAIPPPLPRPKPDLVFGYSPGDEIIQCQTVNSGFPFYG